MSEKANVVKLSAAVRKLQVIRRALEVIILSGRIRLPKNLDLFGDMVYEITVVVEFLQALSTVEGSTRPPVEPAEVFSNSVPVFRVPVLPLAVSLAALFVWVLFQLINPVSPW